MKNYFIGKKFSTELDYWNYLVSIRDNKFDCADGYYLGATYGKDQEFFLKRFEYYNVLEMSNVPHPAFQALVFKLGLRNGQIFEIVFSAFPYFIYEEKKNDQWINLCYEDDPHRMDHIFAKFSKEEIAACFNELCELLVIEGKKDL